MNLLKQFESVWNDRGLLLKGLGISVLIALGAIILGFVIGIVLASVKIAPKNNVVVKILDKFAGAYIAVIRGTPMLVQLLIMSSIILAAYKLSPNNIMIPIIAFGLNSGAYMAEIIRSGINSVDKGQMEAGRSLGLSWITTMFRVVIPQAIKVVVPTIFNEIIMLVKETSVVSAMTLFVNGVQTYDLFGYVEKRGAATGDYIGYLFAAAVMYLAIVFLLTLVQKMIEKRLKKNER